MINLQLVKCKNLSEEAVSEIESIHYKLNKLMCRASLGAFNQSVYDRIEELEFELQDWWGFEKHESKHKYKKLYQWRCDWIARRFKCLETGEVFQIPDDVYYNQFFKVGNGFVDVGDGYYCRIGGNIEEVK